FLWPCRSDLRTFPDMHPLFALSKSWFCRLWQASFTVLLVLVLALPVWADTARTVRIKTVFDGDTVLLVTGETVRLEGIDAPETRHEDKAAQYFGERSKKRLQELVMTRDLHMISSSRDHYGRILGVLEVTGGRSVNEILVEEGMAFFFPHRGQSRQLQEDLLQSQKTAIGSGRGFWPEILSTQTPAPGWVGNTRSKRFHHPRCSQGKKISPKNRMIFPSIKAAFLQGFAPARGCTPWPEAR
ncbi:MAG: thermonuclease family protein, partial [Desulfovibrionales bacterium]